jgi:hypothetical protein
VLANCVRHVVSEVDVDVDVGFDVLDGLATKVDVELEATDDFGGDVERGLVRSEEHSPMMSAARSNPAIAIEYYLSSVFCVVYSHESSPSIFYVCA